MSDEARPQPQAQPQAPLEPPKQRYIFSGHAVGAAAQFNKLNNKPLKKLIVVPTAGSSVLPPTGGLSQSEVSDYSFNRSDRNLLTAGKIRTKAEGRGLGLDTHFETETEVRIDSITVVDKLRIGLIKVNVLSVRDIDKPDPVITTTGNRIDGVELGNVKARIILDSEALCKCGTQQQITEFFQGKSDAERAAAQFAPQAGGCSFSLVREIKLTGGKQADRDKIHPWGKNALYWDGFGWIFFGEVIVRPQDRQVTMVRLQMGSDDGGPGTMGDAQSNGHLGG